MAGGEDSVRFEELHRSYHLICVFLIIVNQFPSATPWWMWPPWRTLLVPGYDHHTLAPTQPSHFGQLCRAVIYLVIIEISCKCQSLESNLVGVHVSIVFPPKACPPTMLSHCIDMSLCPSRHLWRDTHTSTCFGVFALLILLVAFFVAHNLA